MGPKKENILNKGVKKPRIWLKITSKNSIAVFSFRFDIELTQQDKQGNHD